jgi:2-desacetyl-2-hydroxyethyl bacteriochlorophyllide A dehydrogenase
VTVSGTPDGRLSRVNAAVLHGPRDLRLEPVPTPVPGPGEVCVRVRLAGLCGTDYRIWSGDRPVAYPRILGHELVGRVQATGPGVEGLRPGDRVVVEPNYSCGHCPLCREGNRNLCPQRTAVGIDVDGGFGEAVRVPARCCWPAPAAVPDDALLVIEPLAVVVRAVNRGVPAPGDTAAVVGLGTLGLLAIQVLRARGMRVLAVARTPARLDLARTLGAEAVAATGAEPLEPVARRFSGREGVALVVETAGTAAAVAHGLDLVRPGGRVVLTGLPHEPTPVAFFSVVRREISLTGSMIYQDEFPEAIGLVERGAVRSGALVTHRFALGEIDAAFAAHRDPASIKVALEL